MSNDVKNYIYSWCGRNKMNRPIYNWTEHRSVRANGAKSRQPDSFTAELTIPGFDYVAKGEAKAIKLAQTEAARSMVLHLLKIGKLTAKEVQQVPNMGDVIEKYVKPSVEPKAPENPIEKLKSSYGSWVVGELTIGNEIVKKRARSPELEIISQESSDTDQVVFYGSKKRNLETVQIDDDGPGRDFPIPIMESPYKSANIKAYQQATNAIMADPYEQMLEKTLSRIEEFKESGDLPTDEKQEVASTSSNEPEIVEVHTNVEPQGENDVQIVADVKGQKALREEFTLKFGRECTRKFPNHMNRITDQILKHYKDNRQDDETYQKKMKVRLALLEVLKMDFGEDCWLFAVGSTINGCGSFNSDMDLCLVFPDRIYGTDTHRDYSINILRHAMRALRRHAPNLSYVQMIQAKVPILKLTLKTICRDLEVDLNCNNCAGIYNSHLLHYYSRVDERMCAIALIVKHWAINVDILNPMNGKFTSYSLLLLIIHYLQCGCQPAVLPNLQKLFPQWFTGQSDIRQLLLQQEFPAPIPGHHANKQQVSELLSGFFAYYADGFDFQNDYISIYKGDKLPRSQLEDDDPSFYVFIEEPFDGSNTARHVKRAENFMHIINQFRKAKNQFTKKPSLEAIGISL